MDVHSHLKEISDGIKYDLFNEFDKYGLELTNFNTNEITPPENDPSYMKLKNALARKAEMSVVGYDYQQERTYNLLEKAADNEGAVSSVMNVGMGLSMGMSMGNALSEIAVNNGTSNDSPQSGQLSNNPPEIGMTICLKCGCELPKNAKFCFECGEKVELNEQKTEFICPYCGELVPRARFCSACGKTLPLICGACGKEAEPGMKFCPECGGKL